MDLTFLGMPGCALRVSLDAIEGVVGSGNQAQYALTIPARPELVGLQLFQQAIVLDPGVNAFGAVLSAASRAVVGW